MALGEPDTVLVQADESLVHNSAFLTGVVGRVISEFPAIEKLNIVSGDIHVVMPAYPPIRRYLADRHGQVRVGWGYEARSTEVSYYARFEESPGNHTWKLLFKQDAFADGG